MKSWFSAILLLSGLAFAGVLWGQSRFDDRNAGAGPGSWRNHPAAQPSGYAPPRPRYASPQAPVRRVQWSEADAAREGSGYPDRNAAAPSHQESLFEPPPLGGTPRSPVKYPEAGRPVERRDAPSDYAAPQRRVDERRAPARQSELQPIEGSRIIARVGGDVILESEVLGSVDAILAPYIVRLEAAWQSKSMTDGQYKQQQKLMAEQRDKLVRQLLEQLIETKLIYADARRTVPPEAMEKLQADIGKQFEKRGIKDLMERLGVLSRIELDGALRKSGTSLAASKRSYVESQITKMWVQREAKVEKDVSNAELLSYYEQQGDEFDNIGRARWQQLSIRFEHTLTKDEAFRKVARLGNRVLGGETFEAVAKNGSQGFTADKGGVYPWTTQGSLSSKTLDEAIFVLQVGRMSRIIEDDKGFHIVRVLQREDANRTPFSEAQKKIRETILKERREDALATFKKRIRQGATIWTAYDERDRRQQRISERPDSRPTHRFSR